MDTREMDYGELKMAVDTMKSRLDMITKNDFKMQKVADHQWKKNKNKIDQVTASKQLIKFCEKNHHKDPFLIGIDKSTAFRKNDESKMCNFL